MSMIHHPSSLLFSSLRVIFAAKGAQTCSVEFECYPQEQLRMAHFKRELVLFEKLSSRMTPQESPKSRYFQLGLMKFT